MRIESKRSLALFGMLLAFCFLTTIQNTDAQSPKAASSAAHDPKTETPVSSWLPDWAQPGKVRFALWDGGPIEAAKGILSGWPLLFPTDPAALYATVNWYDPKNIELIKEGHFNTIYVDWSVGFSPKSEQVQREILKPFTVACHQQGIKVIAYMSMGNMFWEDMFANEPKSRNWVWLNERGRPVIYGGDASAYLEEVGKVTRYIADPKHPGWHQYLKDNIDGALDAGMDGLYYDNVSYGREDAAQLSSELYHYARKRKPDVLMVVNFDPGMHDLSRIDNTVYSEYGETPGFSTRRSESESPITTTAGFLRYLSAISQGWRPILIQGASLPQEAAEQSGAKGAGWGWRPINSIAPQQHQLSLAETAAFGATLLVYLEGGLLRGMYWREPWAMEGWKAIGEYNRFLEENQSQYLNLESLAQVGVVVDHTERGVGERDMGVRQGMGFLNDLVGANVIYDTLLEDDLATARLDRYKVIVAADTRNVSDSGAQALRKYVEDGGVFIATEQTSFYNEKGNKRSEPALRQFFQAGTQSAGEDRQTVEWGKGRSIYFPKSPGFNALVWEIRRSAGDPLVEVSAPPYVCYNLVGRSAQNEIVLHLLNYAYKTTRNIPVKIRSKVSKIEILSPDSVDRTAPVPKVAAGVTEFTVPELQIYDLVVVHTAARN